MLIDWLPQALKRFYQVAQKSSLSRQARQGRLLTFQVENLEERQLLSAANSYNVALPDYTNVIDPVLVNLATGATPQSFTTVDTSGGVQTNDGATPAGITNLAPTLVAKDQSGRVGVRITTSNAVGLQPSLQALGFITTGSRPDLNFIEGFIPQANIALLGGLAANGLRGVTPLYQAITMAGPTVDQAGGPMNVDRVLSTMPPGYDGTGVTVGILSDSFNANNSVLPALTNGDLPTSVQVLLEGAYGNTDEGRAMAELVHDLAPGAAIKFASAFNGQASFAQQIRNLANPAIGRANIIVDDVIYFDEPFFQDGVIAQAVNDVVNFNGVSYFSAAGNMDSSSFEAINPSFGADPPIPPATGNYQLPAGNYLDFDPSAAIDTRNQITLFGGESLLLELQWDDPFYTLNGVDTDLDIFVIDSFSGQIYASSTSNNIATQTPSELLSIGFGGIGATTVDIVVRLESGPAPGRLKWVDFGSHFSSFTYDTQSSTVYGHAAAEGAMAVAAAPYFDSHNTESFSSSGTTTILFTPTGSPLGTPDVRQTPDITGIDGTNTSFFTGDFLFAGGGDVEGDGLPNFFGTSAAAPHVAAVAALVKQANPGLSPQQIYDRLTSTAIDIGTTGVDNLSGAGLVNAYAAIFGGPIQAGLNFADSFETGALNGFWESETFGNGLITVDSTHGVTEGTRSLTLGSRFDNSFFNFASFDALNEATLHIDLSTATDDVYLSFDAKELLGTSNAGDDPMSDFFFGSENSDGVAISVDGGFVWRKIVSLTGSVITDTFKSLKINLSELASSKGFGLGNDVRIRFQQYDLFFATNPITIDNIQIFTPQPSTLVLNPVVLSYPIGSPPINIDSQAILENTQTPVFDGGTLTVAITQNGTSSDRIEIQNQSLIPNRPQTPNDITLVGNRVLYGGLQIGTFLGGSGTSPLVVSLNSNATVESVEFLLRDITFRSQSPSLLSRTVQVSVDDGTGAGTATATRVINVIAAANVAPTITLSPTALNVQPGTTATIIDGSATVVDTDSPNFAGGVLTARITINASTAYDRLEIKNQGNASGQIGFSGTTIKYGGVKIGTLSGGTTNRTITLTAAATPAAVQALLRSITFRTISTSAPLATRTVQFQLTDGDGGTSGIASKLINVVKRNRSPVLTGTSTIPTYHLGMNPVIIEPSGLVSDPDSPNFNGGTLTVKITANGTAFDRLTVRNQGSNVGQIAVSGGTNILYGGILIGTIAGGNGSGSPLVITFNANANSAAVRALMRSITFQTGGTIPSLKQRTITFQLADGQGGLSNLMTKFVKVSAT